jgi:serine/threonine-protein kinase OSR1/STK39
VLSYDVFICWQQEHIMRETQIMHEMRHPNVMPLYCSFVHKEQLWMVMPYVAGGSLFGIISGNYPQVLALCIFC